MGGITMKRFLTLLAGLSLALVLVACNDVTTGQTTTTTTTAAQDTTTTTAQTTSTTTNGATTTIDSTSGASTTTSEQTFTLGAAYDGTHTVMAMSSEVVYEYFYEFTDGNYVFESAFEMGGTPYSYEESGTYTVDGNAISFTPSEGDPYSGVITSATEISVPVKASSMATRGDSYTLTLREASLGTVYDGTHTVMAMTSEVVYVYAYEFASGNYTFDSAFEMGGTEYTYEESGTYTVDGNAISFTPSEGDPYSGVITSATEISVPVKASSMATRGDSHTMTLRTLGAAYDGTHSVTAMSSEVVYVYAYEFADGNYTFASDFEMGGEPYSYDETGTYTVDGMTITFTPSEGDPYTGQMISATEISVPVKASSMATRGDNYTLTLRQGE